MAYLAHNDGTIVRIADGHEFTLNASEPAYSGYLEWLKAGGTLEKATTPSKKELFAHLAARRYEMEVGGYVSQTFGPMDTSRANQSMIARTIQSIDLGLVQEPITYKSPAGFVQLDRAALIAVGTEIAAHVQNVFNAENEIAGQIASGAVKTTEQIDALLKTAAER